MAAACSVRGASSSTMATAGRRARIASRSHLLEHLAAIVDRAAGTISGRRGARGFGAPCVSTCPRRHRCRPACAAARPAASRTFFPTPGGAPNTLTARVPAGRRTSEQRVGDGRRSSRGCARHASQSPHRRAMNATVPPARARGRMTDSFGRSRPRRRRRPRDMPACRTPAHRDLRARRPSRRACS